MAPAGGALEIAGTDASETLVVTQASGTYTVAGDAPVAPFGALGACVQGSGPNEVVCTPTGPVEVLSVNLADGDDSLTVARVGQTGALPTSVEQLIAGGAGDDTLRAGDGAVTFLESGAPP
ncbi:MAG TPA: hypothetical protein VHF88_05385, partial [Thermoleophilaceae bacterium]|nr:hypothetical protein [Thermoleophilaceae bacterium]